MKKQIILSLKRILCIGLVLNIIYTSVDFSSLNVWAEEEVTESTESEDSDTEISGDTGDSTEFLEGANLEGSTKTPEEASPEEENEIKEEEEKKGFLEKLGNLLPFSLAPLNDTGEESPEQDDSYHGHVLLEGYSFDATISLGDGFRNVAYDDLEGILRGLDVESGNPDLTKEKIIRGAEVYFYDNRVMANCDIIITGNSTAIIRNIPVYIKDGTGDPQKTGGTGDYITDSNAYEIRLSTDPLDENNMYTAHFVRNNSSGSNSSHLNLSLADNDLQWTVTAQYPLDVVRRDVKDAEFDIKIYDGVGVNSIQALEEFIAKNRIGYTFTEDGISRFINKNAVEYVDDVTGRVTLRNIPKDFAVSGSYTVQIPNKKGYKTYIVRGSEITALDVYQGDWDYVLKTIPGGFDSVLYIKDDILTGTVRFMDGNKSSIRPDIDYIKDHINVYDANTNALIEKEKYTLSLTQSEEVSNKWDISITGLPMYTTAGRILHYCYRIDAPDNSIPAKEGVEKYKIQYSNGTSNADMSKAYSGATIYLSLNKENPAYSFKVTWKDDQYNNVENHARIAAGEKINFYLWRSVASTEDGIEISSPVSDANGDQYRIPLKDIENYTDDTFTVDVSGRFPSLPVYNENGYEYTYYLTTLNQTNHSDGYIDSYGQSEENQDSTHIFHDTDVFLTRVGIGNINTSVVWKAEGEKDYIGTKSVLHLQRRVKTETGEKGAWEDIPSANQKEDGTTEEDGTNGKDRNYTEIITGAASDKKTEVEATFYEVQKYDNNGQTYEYRVLEYAFSTEKSFTTIGKTWNPDDNDADMYTTSANYKNHAYQITTEYDDEKERYTITNKLHQDIEYTIDIRWRENVPNGITVDDYREILENRLKDMEHPVTYTMQRNGVNYVTLTISEVTESGDVKYTIHYLNDDMEDSTGTVEIGYVEDSKSVQWLFKVPLAKYDDEGKKYTYAIVGEDDNNTHNGTEHRLVLDEVDRIIGSDKAGMFIDKDYDSARNLVVISHSLAHLGYPYTITVQATWDDNITDYAKRMVDVHILALTKKDGNYYLYKDLYEGKESVQLSSSNEFTKVIYYTPLTLNSSLSEDISEDGLLYYTAVEYAISYGTTDQSHTAELPIFEDVDGKKKLREMFIVAGEETVRTEFKFDPNELLNVYLYSYDVNTTKATGSMFNWDKNTDDISHRSHTKVFHNKLVHIMGDVTVDVNWVDDHNSSNYRKNAYKVELVATVAGREETSLSRFSEPLNWSDYKSQCMNGDVLDNNTYDNIRVSFNDVPQFDSQGNPIAYSIRQWIIDENGHESLIDPTATERTTKNNYIITATSENASASFDKVNDENDEYRVHNTFSVRNTASDINYETKFYVLWHDQAAYQANSRSDMTYKLYYRLEGSSESEYKPYDLSTYNSIVEAVKEGIFFENPYYQTVNYYGLREFTQPDEDGNAYKIHYYLVEEKTDATEGYYDYAIEYYGNNHEDLEREAKVSGSINYWHYDFKDSASINKIGTTTYLNGVKKTEDVCYLPENCVVRNYIAENMEVRGTKQWINMSSRDDKPDCEIYLFRASDYEKDKYHEGGKLDSIPAANSYVDMTTLNEDKSGYVFTKKDTPTEAERYPKYDRYGAVYTYKIAEYIISTDGRPIATEIMGATSDGSSMLINTFDPLQKNNRSITIRKEWKDVDTKKNLPFAKFLVYRMECNYQIEDNGEKVNPSAEEVEFYRVKGAIDYDKGNSVKYDEYLKENAQLVASQYIQFNNKSTDGTGEITIENLRNYAPNGIPYVYFVVEDTSFVPSYAVTNLASDTLNVNNGYGYKLADNVTMCAPVGSSTAMTSLIDGLKSFFGLNDQDNQTVGFSNARNIAAKFITITGTIKWDEGSTAIGKTARPAIEDANNNIRLKITRTSSTQKGEENQISNEPVNIGGATNGYVPGNRINWVVDSANEGIWRYTITLTEEEREAEFLKYASNGNVYVYKVQESFQTDNVKIADNYTAVLGSVSKASTAANQDQVLDVGQMSNALRGEYKVRKIWRDGYNSYGLRPQKILVMYQYKEQDDSNWKPLRYSSELTDSKAGKIIVKEIEGSKWENSITKFPFFTADGKQYTYRAVEIGIGYTSGGTTKWVATTDFDNLNTYETGSEYLDKTSTSWNYNSSGAYGYKEIKALSGADSQNASVEYPYASNGTFGSYRVVVQLDNQNKPQDGTTFDKSNLSSTVTVTNVLDQKYYVMITKTWDDNDNAFGVRPANITYKIQKRVIENKKKNDQELDINNAKGVVQQDWTDVGTVVLSAANEISEGSNTWTKKFDNFPGFDENEDFLEYRALEMGVAESYYQENASEGVVPESVLVNIIPDSSIDKSADKIGGDANNATTVVGGTYNLTEYEYTNNSTSFSVETTNTLKHSEAIVKVNKDWLIKGDSKSGDALAQDNGYSAKVRLSVPYGAGENVKTINATVDLTTGNYQHTWNKIPAYIIADDGITKLNLNYEGITLTEESVKLGADEDIASLPVTYAEDDSAYGSYTDANGNQWITRINTGTDENSNRRFTITNTPLTKHGIEVSYDTDSDSNNTYNTRPESAVYKLQYRVKASTATEWNDIDGSSEIAKSLKGVNYSNITVSSTPAVEADAETEAAEATGTLANVYTAEIDRLPKYLKNTDDTVGEYEYRILEVKAGNQSVEYDDTTALTNGASPLAVSKHDSAADDNYGSDRSVGGYIYEYNDQDKSGDKTDTDSKTYLKKTLLTIELEGKKVWEDQNNIYSTRPAMDASQETQSNTSKVQVKAYKAGEELSGLQVMWKNATDEENKANTWIYYTNGSKLPKYKSHSNILENYTVAETTVPTGYETNHGSTAKVGLAASVGVGNGDTAKYPMEAITNSLEKKNITVNKTWADKALYASLGIEPVSTTYTLQVSTNEGESFTNLLKGSSSGKMPTTIMIPYDMAGDEEPPVNVFEDVPIMDNDGNTYCYRVIESGMKFKLNDSSSNQHTVQYNMMLSDDKATFTGDVNCQVDSGASTVVNTVNYNDLSGTDISYVLGLFNAQIEKTTGTETYNVTNTPKTASASVTVNWKEVVGSNNNDATLIKNFRPSKLVLVLQRRIGDSGTWSDVSAGTDSNIEYEKTITGTEHTFSYSATDLGATKLPLYIVVDGAVNTYEYRIVEKSFDYGTDAGSRELSYNIENNGNTINSDFSDADSNKTLVCNDYQAAGDKKQFYTGTQSNSVADYAYHTTIDNELRATTLVEQVLATLTGEVEWKDGSDVLGKRPNDTGVTMLLRAQIPGDSGATTLSQVEFVIGKSDDETAASIGIDIDTKIFDGKDGTSTAVAKLKWNKVADTDKWIYSIENLPLYDKDGRYITYSVAHENKKVTEDYVGTAKPTVGTTDAEGHMSDAEHKYAFGKVTDNINKYDQTADKRIELVDFVENMNTTFTIVKTWDDQINAWESRTANWYLYLERRVVEVDDTKAITTADDSGWQQAFGTGTDFDKTKVESGDGLGNYILVSTANDAERKATMSGENNKVWTYTMTVPQFDENGDLLQYRATEIGREPTNTGEPGDYVLIDSVATTDSNGSYKNAYHVGSYYMTAYNYSEWNVGYSTTRITNKLDEAVNITVEKKWNVPTDYAADTPNIVTVELVGKIRSNNSVDDEVTTNLTVFQKTLPENGQWKYTYNNLPKYDLQFREIEWSVKEIKVGDKAVNQTTLLSGKDAGISEDGKWLATYTKNAVNSTDDENINIDFTITNTPAINAKLVVKYQDDLENKYSTRPATGKAVLQYRPKAYGGAWVNIPDNLANNIVSAGDEASKSVKDSNGISITTNMSATDSYSYILTNLPIYDIKSDGTKADTYTEYEYRIVETQQGDSLAVNYTNVSIEDNANLSLVQLTATNTGDKASGGYTYEYDLSDGSDKQADSKLTKTLITTTLEGRKLWKDESNAYQTRANAANGVADGGAYKQTDASNVKVTVGQQDKDSIPQPDIWWNTSATGEQANIWTYRTGNLPKYAALTDTLASYNMVEAYGNKQYITTYGDGTLANAKTISTKYAIENDTSGAIIHTLADINNTLQSVSMVAQKKWLNDDGNKFAGNVSFKLQQKAGGDTATFADSPESFNTKTITKSEGNDKLAQNTLASVEWRGLPACDESGNEITYQIVESSTFDNYALETETNTDTATKTTTTMFYNIQLQDYSVNKIWEDTINGLRDDNGSYKSTFELYQSTDNGATWDNVKNSDNTNVEDTLTATYEQTKAEDKGLQTKTYKNLPRFTRDGKVILYKAVETKINGVSQADVDAPMTKSYEVTHNYTKTDDGKYSVSTSITNKLREVPIVVLKYDKDDNNKPMQNVEFTLYKVDENGNAIEASKETKYTDENGRLAFYVLDLGMYRIVETRPSGYIKAEDIDITISSEDYNREEDYKVYNERKLGALEIHKLDEDTDNALDDIQFALYKKNESTNIFEKIWFFITGNIYSKVTAEPESSTGVTKIENIPWGSYYIVEERALDGYKLSKTEYHFEVNATTVENPIQLASITDNKIRNFKNSFTFKKQSTDETSVEIHAGKYSLNRIENGSETEVETFELSDSIHVKDFTGVKAGDYIIRELEAPAGYRKNEDGVRFTLTEEGQIVKTGTQTEWTGNTVILTDIPVAKFTVTKQFAGDDDWKETIRPTAVKIQLYSSVEDNFANKTPVGDPVTIYVNTTDNEYSYEFTNLPMVNDAGKKLKYEAEEVELLYKDGDAEISVTPIDFIYTVDYGSVTGGDGKISGAEYAQTITNTAPTGKEISVKKVNHNGPQGKKFTFDVYAGKNEDHAVKINEFELAANDHNTYGTNNLAEGEFKLKVPNVSYYEVKECLDEADPLKEYNVSYVWDDDTTKTYLTVTNDKIIYTMIENNTAEEEKKEEHTPNPGGKVAIIEKGNSGTNTVESEDRSQITYKEGYYGVYWQAEDDGEWALPDSFTIRYTEPSGTEGELQGSVTVEDYLVYDQDGKTVVEVKEKADSCYTNLKTRYKDFEIEYDSTNKRVVLYLADKEDGLPYLNEIEIEFRPTVAVINTTDYYAGGMVKVNNGEYQTNSDGKKENGTDDRYVQETIIYAEAEKGYCVDLSSIQIENVDEVVRGLTGQNPDGDDNNPDTNTTAKAVKKLMNEILQPVVSYAAGSPVSLDSDNTFIKTINYLIDGTVYDYKVSGKVEIEERDAFTNPSKVKLVLSGLPVPIDVGIAFVESKDRRPNISGGNAEDETLSEGSATNTQLTNKTSSVTPPKTGDTKELYLWIMILAAGICISMLGIFKAIQQLSLDNSKAGGQDEK